MNDTTTATVRTTVQGTVLTALASLLSRWFGWNITLDDLLPLAPLVAFVIAVFYRLSRMLTERFPILKYILFGVGQAPTYTAPEATQS